MNDNALSAAERHTAQRVAAQLQLEADSLNSVECARIKAARHRALSRATDTRRTLAPGLAWAAAAVLAIAVAVPLLHNTDDATLTASAPAAPNATDELFNDLPLLATGDDVEFLQDLEFLLWLEAQDDQTT